MKPWAYWERIDNFWQNISPTQFPAYEQWRADVERMHQLSNPGGLFQQVLDAMDRFTIQEWRELESRFCELIIFSFWMEIIVQCAGPKSLVLNQEILMRYEGFTPSNNLWEPPAHAHALIEWALKYQLTPAQDQEVRAALSYCTRSHPRYHALWRYAQHCHHVWQENLPSNLPQFEEWIQAGDQHVEYR